VVLGKKLDMRDKDEEMKSGEGARPLVHRLNEIESELRLISSRVDNSVRVDDKVKLEKELLSLRNNVSDFSARFAGEMEGSSSRLKREIEAVTKNLEMEIRELSKGAREDLNLRRDEIEESIKKLNFEVKSVSSSIAREIKDLGKGVEANTNSRFISVEDSLARLKSEVEGISRLMGSEFNELDKKILKNSTAELEKKVLVLEKLADDSVRLEEKVKLERELGRVKDNLNVLSIKLSDEVSGVSRKLGFEIEDFKKRAKEDFERFSGDMGKVFVGNRNEVSESLKKFDEGLRNFVGKFDSEILGLSRRIDRENKEGADKVNADLEKLVVKMDGVLGLESEIVGLKNEVATGARNQEAGISDMKKILDERVKAVVVDVGKEIMVLKSEAKKSFDGVALELKDVGKKAGLELRDFVRKIDNEIAVLSKEVSRNSLLEVGSRVRDLEKGMDGFVRIGDKMKLENDFLKMKSDLEDLSLKTREEAKFSVKRIEESLKDVSGKIAHEIRGLEKRVEANSLLELVRRVNILEKELDSVSVSLNEEDSTVEVLKKNVDDKIFMLEREIEKLNSRLDGIAAEGKEQGVSDKEGKEMKDKIRELEVKLGNFEGRVDLENEKIYDRLAESLDLMMFWEKKLARLSDEPTRNKDGGMRNKGEGIRNNDEREGDKVLIKKRENQIRDIRERKSVLERLRRSHVVSFGNKIKGVKKK